MADLDLAGLRRLAEAAGAARWRQDAFGDVQTVEGKPVAVICTLPSDDRTDAYAAHIALDPPTASELITRAERLERAEAILREMLDAHEEEARLTLRYEGMDEQSDCYSSAELRKARDASVEAIIRASTSSSAARRYFEESKP